MEYIKLKNSDLKVSRLCMGGCPLGGHGWGSVQENELKRAVEEAVESGITFFDTADTYGLGRSEVLLGKALKDKRNHVVIASKFGVRVTASGTIYDNSSKWIEEALNNSLRRLGTEYIDLYQIHYRDERTPLETVVETLEKMKEKGYIRYFGLSNIHEKDKNELKSYKGRFVSFQEEYSLACRKNEADIKALSEQLGLTPCTWGSLGQGILTGKYDENTKFSQNDRRSREVYVNFHGKKLLKNLKIVELLKQIAKENNKPVSAAAIRFILDYLPESVVLAGAKSGVQIKENIKAFSWKLTQEQIERLEYISR